MCLDLELVPIEIIRLYGYRFKIEVSFEQSLHVGGSGQRCALWPARGLAIILSVATISTSTTIGLEIFMSRFALAFVLVVVASASAQDNLAAGIAVQFANTPNYRHTAQGGTDAVEMTDGALTSRTDDSLWFDSATVGYSYGGLAQIAVDLGDVKTIGEVGIRLQGGSPQPGITVPVWLDLAVSDDGVMWYRIDGYSAFNDGDFERVGIPADAGQSWVHRLRFTDLEIRARHVGLSFYATGLSVSDEMWVLGSSHPERDVQSVAKDPFPMAMAVALPYFHKPKLWIPTNIVTPVPIGLIGSPEALGREVRVQLDVPQGVELAGGAVGGVKVGDMATETIRHNGRETTRYTLKATPTESTKTWDRVFVRCQWRPGQEGVLRYRVDDGEWFETPMEGIAVQPVTAPTRLCVGLSWWGLGSTAGWPDVVNAYKTLGFNTVPMFSHWTKPDDAASWALLDKLRAEGFEVMNIDSPLHRMVDRHKSNPDIYCQFEDGTHGTHVCPSYRGSAFEDEVRRVATVSGRCRGRYHNWDIELWSWRGPVSSRKCTRCIADKEASGIDDWEQWQQAKGLEMFTALTTAVGDALRANGVSEYDIGMYDLRPGSPYQFTWNFKQLYPQFTSNSQVSTYTPYYSYHLDLIAREVREDRELLPASDQMPWLTPGDAGVFPGRAFKYALLEVFANGSRGVNFWSSRVWDGESLAAYADAIRIVRQVEDVIVDGEPLSGAEASKGVRVSGMQHKTEMFVLVSDYDGDASGHVRVQLPVARPSRVIDLETGNAVADLTPASAAVHITFAGERARAYHVMPR
ncbi:MAG: hypothetical protein HON70_05665 [Lentisphaerae bacterium]|nr:hypothetical protein [Lentisphaerota bacterium]